MRPLLKAIWLVVLIAHLSFCRSWVVGTGFPEVNAPTGLGASYSWYICCCVYVFFYIYFYIFVWSSNFFNFSAIYITYFWFLFLLILYENIIAKSENKMAFPILKFTSHFFFPQKSLCMTSCCALWLLLL